MHKARFQVSSFGYLVNISCNRELLELVYQALERAEGQDPVILALMSRIEDTITRMDGPRS